MKRKYLFCRVFRHTLIKRERERKQREKEEGSSKNQIEGELIGKNDRGKE